MSTMALRELRMDDAAEPSVLKCYKVTLLCYITMLHYNVVLWFNFTLQTEPDLSCPAMVLRVRREGAAV